MLLTRERPCSLPLLSVRPQLVTSGNVSKYANVHSYRPPNISISRYESFKLIGLHPLCAMLFTTGYALREYGAFNYLYSTKNLIVFILSQVFIYICP